MVLVVERSSKAVGFILQILNEYMLTSNADCGLFRVCFLIASFLCRLVQFGTFC